MGYTTSITRGRLAVWGVVSVSVTVTVKLVAPTAVGVPLIVPVEERLNPGGRLPAVRL